MDTWRWILVALVGGLLAVLAAILFWPGSDGEFQTVLPYEPQTVCQSLQQVLTQLDYDVSAANCRGDSGWIEAAITFIPDKSGSFIPDKSGNLRNQLHISLQPMSDMGTMLKLDLQSLRFDRNSQRWQPDPNGPLYFRGEEIMRTLLRQLRN
ncbi:MAG: hypothetical protein ABEL51_14500 [Salinibacter sp.]